MKRTCSCLSLSAATHTVMERVKDGEATNIQFKHIQFIDLPIFVVIYVEYIYKYIKIIVIYLFSRFNYEVYKF